MTGGTVEKVTIDPDQGGSTHVEGGHAPSILAAGYIGSTVFGGVFVLAGFDTLVAKIVSFVLGLGLITPLVLVRTKLCVRRENFHNDAWIDALFSAILLTAVYEGLLIGFWFVDHGWVFRMLV